jgi:hypothetical protein
LNVESWQKEFPGATVLGVPGLPEKAKGVRWDGIFGSETNRTEFGFESEIETEFVDGFANRDVLAFHRETKTLMVWVG